MKNIYSYENMQKSVDRLIKNKYGCGIDEIHVEQYAAFWDKNKTRICKELRTGRYVPQPVLQYEKWKQSGKKREISKYTCTDRVILDAIKRAMTPILEKQFSEYSFGYREKKGTQTAVKQAAEYIESGKKYVLELDIKEFFDNINLQRLEYFLQCYITNKKLLNIVHKYLYPTVVDDDHERTKKTIGVVQGSPISPLLSNLYMVQFDRYLEEQYLFCRYADNINVYFETEEQAVTAQEQIKEYLRTKLGLTINGEKSGIYEALTRKYLGYEFYCVKGDPYVYTRRVIKGEKEIHRSWNKTSIQEVDGEYHLIHDGILRKKDFSLLFEKPDGKRFIPVETCKAINVYSNVMLDGAILQYLNEKKVMLSIFDQHNRYVGSFYSPRHGKVGRMLLKQVALYMDVERRLELAKKIEIASLHNLRENLRYYNKKDPCTELKDAIEYITNAIDVMKRVETIENLLITEANAKYRYLHQLDRIIQTDEFQFEKRTRRPPENAINALISFGNVLLYNHIATEIHKTSLDIRIGIVHATNERPDTLNLDIAEIFKPIIVEKTIFRMIHNRQIRADKHFEVREEGGIYLNKEGKRIYITELRNSLSRKITVDGEQISYYAVIRRELQKYCNYVDREIPYSPYKYSFK